LGGVGGMVLHKGEIAEMRTGEGKTLVAILPAYLNALVGKGVHVVTVNDYLARRDCEWVGQVPRFLGMKVGLIQRMSHTSFLLFPIFFFRFCFYILSYLCSSVVTHLGVGCFFVIRRCFSSFLNKRQHIFDINFPEFFLGFFVYFFCRSLTNYDFIGREYDK
jgi:hypothetical protein